ncbi:group III truncated hemoglobin [Bosea sp. (in: a-proteobacteria)]|uniref:group III truncated hemoglobin n=1 Tax=Bosea sp. (in: a-proteobacteria) TaxID=1871050 RepID=UPI002FC64E31
MSRAALPEEISEALIARLVDEFYGRARRDPLLGPIFEAQLGQRWDEHLAALRDFWSSVALQSGRYRGRPQQAHQPLGLAPEHFARWLCLFEATVAENCAGPAAALFIDRARRIAESLQIGLNIGPKALAFAAPGHGSESGR